MSDHCFIPLPPPTLDVEATGKWQESAIYGFKRSEMRIMAGDLSGKPFLPAAYDLTPLATDVPATFIVTFTGGPTQSRDAITWAKGLEGSQDVSSAALSTLGGEHKSANKVWSLDFGGGTPGAAFTSEGSVTSYRQGLGLQLLGSFKPGKDMADWQRTSFGAFSAVYFTVKAPGTIISRADPTAMANADRIYPLLIDLYVPSADCSVPNPLPIQPVRELAAPIGEVSVPEGTQMDCAQLYQNHISRDQAGLNETDWTQSGGGWTQTDWSQSAWDQNSQWSYDQPAGDEVQMAWDQVSGYYPGGDHVDGTQTGWDQTGWNQHQM